MKGQRKFTEAQKLRGYGLSYKVIGKMVAAMEDRKVAYSDKTIGNWLQHNSWKEYSQYNQDAFQRFKDKKEMLFRRNDEDWSTASSMPDTDPVEVAEIKRTKTPAGELVLDYITQAFVLFSENYPKLTPKLDYNTEHLIIIDIARMIQAEELSKK